jgi:hypothetical protein
VAGRPVPLAGVLRTACKGHAMPTAFFHGDEDAKGKEIAKNLTANLKIKNSKKHDYIGPAVLENTNLTGVKLLTAKGLKTTDLIVEYLDTVVKDRGNDYEPRNFQDQTYVWMIPGTMLKIGAKNKLDKGFRFDSYVKFITP